MAIAVTLLAAILFLALNAITVALSATTPSTSRFHTVGDLAWLTNHDQLYQTEEVDEHNVRHWFHHESTLPIPADDPSERPAKLVYKYDAIRSKKWKFVDISKHVKLLAGHMYCHHPESHLALHQPSEELIQHLERHDPYTVLIAPRDHLCMRLPINHRVLNHQWHGKTIHLHTQHTSIKEVYHTLDIDIQCDRDFSTHDAFDHGEVHPLDQAFRERNEEKKRRRAEEEDKKLAADAVGRHSARGMRVFEATNGTNEEEDILAENESVYLDVGNEKDLEMASNATLKAMAGVHNLATPKLPSYNESLAEFPVEAVDWASGNLQHCYADDNCTGPLIVDDGSSVFTRRSASEEVLKFLETAVTGKYDFSKSFSLAKFEFRQDFQLLVLNAKFRLFIDVGFKFQFKVRNYVPNYLDFKVHGTIETSLGVGLTSGQFDVLSPIVSKELDTKVFSIGPITVVEDTAFNVKVGASIWANAYIPLGFAAQLNIGMGIKYSGGRLRPYAERNGFNIEPKGPESLSEGYSVEVGGSPIKLVLENSNKINKVLAAGPVLELGPVYALSYPYVTERHNRVGVLTETVSGLGGEMDMSLVIAITASISLELKAGAVELVWTVASVTRKVWETTSPLMSGYLCCKKVSHPAVPFTLLSHPRSCDAQSFHRSRPCHKLYVDEAQDPEDVISLRYPFFKDLGTPKTTWFAATNGQSVYVRYNFASSQIADGLCFQQRSGPKNRHRVRIIFVWASNNPEFGWKSRRSRDPAFLHIPFYYVYSTNIYCAKLNLRGRQYLQGRVFLFRFFYRNGKGNIGGSLMLLTRSSDDSRRRQLDHGFNVQQQETLPPQDTASTKQNITAIGPGESGKTWEVNLTCPNGDRWFFDISALIQPNNTYYQVEMNKESSLLSNGTVLINDTYTSTQRILLVTDEWPVFGTQYYVTRTGGAVFEQLTGYKMKDSAFDSTEESEQPLNIHHLVLTFGENSVSELTVDHPALCLPLGMIGKVFDVQPPQTSEELDDLFDIRVDLPQNMAYAVRIGLGVCLAIGVCLIVGLAVVRRSGNPSKTQPHTWLEFSALGCTIALYIVIMALGFSGWASPFAKIEGVQQNQDETFVKKSFVFRWWYVELDSCPQRAECTPNCAYNCTSFQWTWKEVQWPFCPHLPKGTAVTQANMENHQCDVDYPWTVGLYTCLGAVCGVGMLLSLLLMRTKVQRFLLGAGFGMFYSLMVYLTHQRIVINVRNAYLEFFAPAVSMVSPYRLEFRALSEHTWDGMVALSFILPAIYWCYFLVAVYMWYNKIDEDESKWENEPTFTGEPKAKEDPQPPSEGGTTPVESTKEEDDNQNPIEMTPVSV